ncbi:MAG: hypothetical protein HQL23_07565, partial [Candidatus Omnitrophica bacterium]|nr:hypothetical protein [Candidatus Omnitrophota bacterium]
MIPPSAFSQSGIFLPPAGAMVRLSAPHIPPVLKGIKVYTHNPLRLDFILDTGEDKSLANQNRANSLSDASRQLIKYFLAALTVPEKDLWVNLSPYEKNRVI